KSDPYDYDVEISVRGEAPKTPNPMLAKAVAKISFTRNGNATAATLVGSLDDAAATAAFESISKDCALRDATFSTFTASSTHPMTPDFDVVALASAAVDNALGCASMARFFVDAPTRFPKKPPSGP